MVLALAAIGVACIAHIKGSNPPPRYFQPPSQVLPTPLPGAHALFPKDILKAKLLGAPGCHSLSLASGFALL